MPEAKDLQAILTNEEKICTASHKQHKQLELKQGSNGVRKNLVPSGNTQIKQPQNVNRCAHRRQTPHGTKHRRQLKN